MDRSIKKNGVPVVRVGQRWQSNDRRDRPEFSLEPRRVLEVVSVSAGPAGHRVRCLVVAGRQRAVGQYRMIRTSAFLGGSRGFTLVAEPGGAGATVVAAPQVRYAGEDE